MAKEAKGGLASSILAAFLWFFPFMAASNSCPFKFASVLNFTNICNQDQGPAASARTIICCEDVYGAAVFLLSQRANSTGEMFLSKPVAETCINIYEQGLMNSQHLQPLFFQSYCPLPASRITANASSCSFGSVTDLQHVIDISNVSEACGHFQSGQKGCQACQTQLLQATEKLVGKTGDQPGSCGTAIAIALTSLNPSWTYFENFYQCVLQILNGVPITEFLNISTAPISSPTTGKSHTGSPLSSRTLFAIVGTAAGVATIGFLVVVGFYVSKSHGADYDISSTFSVSGGLLTPASSEPAVLPTEGFYVFHFKELVKATNNFSDALIVGEGSAGTVYVGQLPSGKLIAVKRIVKEKKVETFYKEVELLARTRHANLVALLGYCRHKFVHLLVYEFMSNGDLGRRLLDKSGQALSWDQRVKIAIECAKGLTYLHECPEGPIIHRDIKPTNILLNDLMEAKLSDFGLSKILEMEASHVSTEIRGTTGYLDPEYLILAQLTEASDVYSFGVVLLQLISGRKAIDSDSSHNRSIVQLAISVMNHEAKLEELIDPRMEGVYPLSGIEKVANVAYSCIQPRSYNRPSMAEVLDELETTMKLGNSYPSTAIKRGTCNNC